MASFTYDDFRRALKRAGFEKLRSEKHETWRKMLQRDIPKWLFHEMLRQAGLSAEEFTRLLRE